MSAADVLRAAPGVADRAPAMGLLIVNADDWGRDTATTDAIAACVGRKSVTAVSAMVFMEDSERAAALALERDIDAGLHLNFTSPLTGPRCPSTVAEHQRRLRVYLRRHPLAHLVFNPFLVRAFEYVTKAQLDEYRRLYGTEPRRIDGHHHMHLSANVLLTGLLPAGTLVRRNFSFQTGEKGLLNRQYRRVVDAVLTRRHRMVDFLFSLAPLEPRARLLRIFTLSRTHRIELETHPVLPDEYRFLTGDDLFRWTDGVQMSSASAAWNADQYTR